MDKTAAIKSGQVKFISKKSPDYKLEFINGALSNVTPRGEIVCDFHLEFRDMPTEQEADVFEDGSAKLGDMKDAGTFTRDVKFGIVMNAQFAKDLVRLLNDKIKECDNALAKGEKGDRA